MTENKSEPSQTRPDAANPPTPAPGDYKRERPTPEGDGLDPTRYGDWEKNGRCIDF
jgi:hypothetical protein